MILSWITKKISRLDLPSLTGPLVKQHTEHYRPVKKVGKNQFIHTLETYSSADTVDKYDNSDERIWKAALAFQPIDNRLICIVEMLVGLHTV